MKIVIAVLFTMAKRLKMPKCPSAKDAWIEQNVVYTCNEIVISFSHKKEGGSDTCYNLENLENIMGSEINQTEKDKY